MKFQICIGNPPYQGKGDPLYMQITKAAYDTVLDGNGVMCMINPTALIDNKYEGSTFYEGLKTKYKDVKVLDFVYEKGLMGVFTSVEVGNDLGIFYYSKNGEHTLFDDWTKQIRFGEDYIIDKEIVDLIKSKPMLGKLSNYIYVCGQSADSLRKLVKKFNKLGNNYVVCSFNRGHKEKNGECRWDWTTLMNSDNFLIQNHLPVSGQSSFDFGNDKESAMSLIKWINTDFLGFFVLYYKASLSNPQVMFERLPQPPESGDFSDESLMKEFGLTENQMKHIHNKMKDYGWKTRDLVKDHKESSLLQFIDDLNNGKAKLPESKKGKKNTSVEPDSSPSGSELSKSPSEMTLDELKVEFKKDYDEWFKADEEEDFETWLKNKYPGMFIRKDED